MRLNLLDVFFLCMLISWRFLEWKQFFENESYWRRITMRDFRHIFSGCQFLFITRDIFGGIVLLRFPTLSDSNNKNTAINKKLFFGLLVKYLNIYYDER